MNEVFEKIIEKLEEEIKNEEQKAIKADIDETIYLITALNAMADRYRDAIGIVKQAAAEYNNGWIPCSERLPDVPKDDEDEKPYLVTVRRNDGFIFWDRLIYHDCGWRIPSTCAVIAWCDVEPYQPKGE